MTATPKATEAETTDQHKPTWICIRGHWRRELTGEYPTCVAQDDAFGSGPCGEAMTYEPTIGDIFASSWGYDQTNVDFYEVVGLTKSGKSVKVLRIMSRLVSDDGPSTRVVPLPRAFQPVYDRDLSPRTKRVRTSYRDGSSCWPAFNLTSYSDAYLWDGKPEYQTGANWGH